MNIGNKAIAFMTAFLMVISPLQKSFIVTADEDLGDTGLTSEGSRSEVSWDIEAKRDTEENEGWKEKVITDEIQETEQINETDETNATDVTMENVETGDTIPAELSGESGIIIEAATSEEYFKLISDFPDCERIIVDTAEDLSVLKVSYGIYYDGTYILGFEDDEHYAAAVKSLSDMGCEYAEDGMVSICGDNDELPGAYMMATDASVRVAVIDTGSDLAGEKYTVTGDDAEDHNGHGTMLSSYILKETGNAYIISIKAIGDNGRGNMSDVYAAVQMAEELGVDYILMAVSIRDYGNYDAFKTLIGNTKAVVVASAGNNGSDASGYLPAGIDGVITVGSLNDDCTLNETSNYGDSVDYYVKAGSTSEAASTALGVIIDGREDELPTEYFDSSFFDEQYHLIMKADDEFPVFVTDDVHDQKITVYEPDAYWLPDLFVSASEKYVGVFSDADSSTMDSHILYCVEDTKEAPSDNDYGMKDWRDGTSPDETYNGDSSEWIKQTQAACAFGPSGSLYSLGVKWWKDNDTSDIIRNKNNAEMKKAMYVITHLVCCKAYSSDGSWPDSTPKALIPLLNGYLSYIMGVRNGETTVQGYTLSGWWCEFYRCREFGEDGVWSNTYGKIINNATFQIMARGNVTKSPVPSDISITVEKSPDSVTDSGYPGFEGTTYTLYQRLVQNNGKTGFELQNELAVFVLNDDGTTDTVYQTTRSGNSAVTFYLKESQAAAGYRLDDTVYQIRIASDGSVSAGVMDTSGKFASEDPDKVTVTDDAVDIIHVKDSPDKAVFRLDKKLGENYYFLAGQTYSFEFWDNTANVRVAEGSAVMPKDANASSSVPVRWSGIAGGYSIASGNRIVIIPGHEYQVMETTMTVNGRSLETPSGWNKGTVHGKTCFYRSFTAEEGRAYHFDAKNNVKSAKLNVVKKIGTVSELLKGQTYDFVLLDKTSGVQAATGTATVPAGASDSDSVSVVWTDIRTGYRADKNNDLYIIPGHVYEIRETTVIINGREMVCPDGWLNGNGYFYKTFTAVADTTHTFTAVNNTSVQLSITKASSDTGITGGNNSYSLAGAKYVLATDAGFAAKDITGSFTVKADGTSDTVLTVERGVTYYLKETAAGKGYYLDKSVYKIVIDSDAKATVSTYSGSGKAAVKNGDPILINVKDQPKTAKISIAKGSSDPSVSGNIPNSVYNLAGATYELYSNKDCTGKVCTFVMKSDGTTDTSYTTAYGKTYYLKETKAGKGFELDKKTYTVTVGSDGKVTVNNGAKTDNSGTVKIVKVTDVPMPARFSLVKKLGTNASLLAGQTYDFELWDMTANKKVASGSATVPSDASATSLTPVVWSDIAAGYSAASDDQLVIIPTHSYQVRETTTAIRGRALNCPSGWKRYNGEYFYFDFSTDYGQIYTFTATNSTTVQLSLTKTSAEPDITDGNKAYDLSGAKYVLSTASDFSGTAGSFTLRSDGTADRTVNVTCGTTYYLKEIVAATGYELDTSVYKIVIGPDADADVSTYSGSGRAVVKNGDPILISVKDQPKTTKISIAKSSSDPLVSGSMPNSVYDLAGTTYGLYSDQDCTGKVCTFVMKSDGTTDTSYTTAYGKTYYLKETKAGKGFELDKNTYKVTVGFDGKITVNNGAAADNSGIVKTVKVTDVPMTARISLMKKLGTNASLLAGQTYDFELWDMTANKKVASGEASVPSNASSSSLTPVVWSDIAAGYSAASDDQLVIIPAHSYQVRETTTSIRGRTLNCPSGWKQFKDEYFYLNFEAEYGQTYSFTATNSVTVQLSLTKTSAEPGITDGNKAYDLTDAEYVLSADEDFSSISGSFTLQSDGTTDRTVNVTCGKTYYLKETAAAKGYELDTSVYKITIDHNAEATVTTYSGSGMASVNNGDPILISVKDQPKTAQISITKVSADMAMTNGNSCYSLAGTSYALYVTADDAGSNTNELTVFTVGTDGKASAKFITAYGMTYYLKEITAGRGYQLDEKIYKVTVDDSGVVSIDNDVTAYFSGGVYYIKLSDAPVFDQIEWSIIKQDPSGWNKVTDRCLDGAVFRLDYYDRTDVVSDSDVDRLNGIVPKVTVELTSLEAADLCGRTDISIDTISAADLSGYFKSFSSTGGLPLGTYRVTEIKAPDGYSAVNDPAVFYIVEDGGKAVNGIIGNSSFYNIASESEVVMNEPALVGFYAPSKSADGAEQLITGLHSLDGTKYGIYYRANGKIACTVTFNAGGSVSDVVYASGIRPSRTWRSGDKTIELAAGEYYAKELSSGSWFFVDGTSYGFSIEAGSTSDMEFKDSPVIPKISTVAVDADTDGHNLSFKDKVTIKDIVSYEGLVSEEEYVLTGALYNAKTGELYKDDDGNTYTKTIKFIPGGSDSVNGISSGGITVVFEDVQIPVEKITLTVFEKLYKDDLLIASHEDLNDKDQTVKRLVPEIGTTASDAGNGTHFFAYKEKVSLKDEVRYANLNAGETYYLTGTLYDAATGKMYTDPEGNTYKKTVVFTAPEGNGTETIEFEDVFVPLTETTIVVFEELYEKTTDNLIAVHADLKDKGQTVRRPEIHTAAFDKGTGTQYFSYTERVTLVDRITYRNLIPGKEYTVSGSLYNAATGERYKDPEGRTYTKTVRFTPAAANSGITDGVASGVIEVSFEDVCVPLEETEIVVFEKLYLTESNTLVASHADLNDEDQTVERRVPEIGTTAEDTVTGSHTLALEEKVSIRDTVRYTNLNPGEVYYVTGILYDADTGRVYTDSKGNTYTKTVDFTAAEPDGSVEITFTGVLIPYEKTTIVVFEDLYEKTTDMKIASHADLSDEDQTVRRPEISTTAVDADTGTHFSSYKDKVAINDNVVYKNLVAGEEYVITGTLYDADTGDVYKDSEGKTYSGSVVFRPDGNDGQVTVSFEDVEVPSEGKTVVVFERLYEKSNEALIAAHEDINYKGQSVERRVPLISTAAADADTGTHFLSYRERVSITDNVMYRNLNAGEEYIVTGTLYDSSTGEVYKDPEGNSYSKSVVFTPLTSDGNVEVLFADVLVPYEKTVLVVFEDLYERGTENKIASHADLNDKDQTVERRVPDIRTTATDAGTGTHVLIYEEKVSVNDVVSYTNLNVGETYYLIGTLYNADTGNIYTDRYGKTYTTTFEFTALASDGEVIVGFTDVIVPFEKTSLVVFEELYEKTSGARIAVHADLKDEDQTVRRPSAGTEATVLNAKEIWLGTAEVTDITITDRIVYSGFEAGRTYRAEATIFKSDGSQILADSKPVMSTVSFVPAAPDGEIKVDITFSTEGLAEGDRIVVFEKIYDVATDDEISSAVRTGEILVAVHEDLSDEDQTITVHFRPMTGGIIPSYSVAGNVIASVSSVIIGIWFFVSRRKRYNGI